MIKNVIFMIIIFVKEIEIKSQMEVYFTFKNIGMNFIYCDVNNRLFASYVKAYKIINDEKINIISQMGAVDYYHCKRLITYYTNTQNETVFLQFENFPIFLYAFFLYNTADSIKIISKNTNFQPNFYCMLCICYNLRIVDLSEFYFENANSVQDIFSNSYNIEEIIFQNNTIISSIESYYLMFSQLSKLTSIDLSHFDFSKANNFMYMFNECSSLAEIIWPKRINILSIQQLAYMFYNCNKLTSIELSGYLKCVNPSKTNTYLNTWFSNTHFSKLNFFNFSIECDSNLFINMNSLYLKDCLYYKYESDIKKCSFSIGFHKCDICNNQNIEEYCVKTIENVDYTFYYLDEHFDLPYYERECYWSYNNMTINHSLRFITNEITKMNYYTFKFEDSCEICSQERMGCLKCNEEKGYYRKENDLFNCYKEPPNDNYALDSNVKEWRKCNERCRKCVFQSRSEKDHGCIMCNFNYYSFLTDHINYENKQIPFNCYNLTEIEQEYNNYFINDENYIEKCDISCKKCTSTKICIICNENYYNIYDYNNGTCFKYPLEKYGLINFNGETFFKQCYDNCKYCSQITGSFLYPQCTECDENEYTLDIYSYNKSICIPNDKSDSIFLKNKIKWYIEKSENFIELENITKDLIIDNERLLNKEEYYSLYYNITKECPKNKPYIIYSIRQCVSSCNSTNYLENGLFMIKDLYFYNNICYDECPKGSIKNEENKTCIEINKYTLNMSLTIESFKDNNINNIYIYLEESANNSVGITRAIDFSNYFYNETINETFKAELQMPIIHFKECLEKMQLNYYLDNNSDIFTGIMEYNDQKKLNNEFNVNSNYINSTNFQFFTNNGTILNYSVCAVLGYILKLKKK